MSDDEDFYAPEGAKEYTEEPQPEAAQEPNPEPKQEDEDLEEGEEEDEEDDGSDSDIDIITERKDGSKPAPATQSKYNEIRNIPQRSTANDAPTKPTAVKKKAKEKGASASSGADLPGVSTSKIDIDAKPVYEPAGKRITQVNIDEDLNENEKPWRRPGTDVSDYFNYGFDEFTWALYASKQEANRSEYSQDKIAQNQKKMFEDMNMMMNMGAMPGMGAGGAMPGMDGMTPEMQAAMMQQMMGSGMDPSQMDPAAMYAAMQGAAGGGGGAGNQGQGFGGQGFGQGQNQMDYSYGQGQGGGNNRGGNFGRGRGGRRNW